MTELAAMRLEFEDGLARLTFTDSSRGNPIDGRFCSELLEVAIRLSGRRDVRAVIVSAQGRAFSYGGEIGSLVGDLDELPRNILRWTADLHSAIVRLQRIDAPIVAAVHGVCAGGMAAFVAGCDIVLASERASFQAAYPGIGFSCDAGATFMLSRRMGPARARRFLLLNEGLDAEASRDAGLIDELVIGEELLARAEAVARKLASGPTRAYGEIRRLFLTVADHSLEAQLELEAQALSRVASSTDAREGLTAFAAKRPALFKGE